MPIQRTKSLQDLYQDVSGYDLVLVPDAPLASAINRRLDRPHFGTFAVTPRRLAAGRREQAEDRVAFLEVIEQTDRDENAAYNVLQRGLQELGLGHAEVTPAKTALPTSATGDSSTVVDAKCVVETGSPALKEQTASAVSE